MAMLRFVAPAAVLAVVSLVGLVGCGSGGTPAVGNTSGQQVFLLDFVHHTVAVGVRPEMVERSPGLGTAPLLLHLTLGSLAPGSPGQVPITATVKNNGGETVGVNSLGTVLGLDLCVTSTIFQNSSGTPVTGGTWSGNDALNPTDGTPIYHLPQSLASGRTSTPRTLEVTPPPTATLATVTLLVRTDSASFTPPGLNRWFLSTLAGRPSVLSFQNGPAASAEFSSPNALVFREGVGDLIISEWGNDRLRRLYQGQVTTFAGDGTDATCTRPWGIGQDAAGNLIVGENGGFCLDLVGPIGGSLTMIAGSRGNSGDASNCSGSSARFSYLEGMAVNGNLTYVCDAGNRKMKLMTFNGLGSRTDPSAYYVTDITYGAAFIEPEGVALDAQGNVYMDDKSTDKIYILPAHGTSWSVIAGSGAGGFGPGQTPPTDTDGIGLSASFNGPDALAVDQADMLYVGEMWGALRRVRPLGGSLTNPTNWVVETLVPRGAVTDGFTGTGSIGVVRATACAQSGTLYLSDDQTLRRLDWTSN
jgi:hypothetical protein